MLGIRRYRGVQIDLFQGDITRFACDIIVNAANEQLAGGGGVDGAIHKAAGPSLLEHCREIGGCPTGEAVVTTAGDLPARWVVHTVGPRWRGGEANEAALLRSAYINSLQKAGEKQGGHVTFPAISTGVYKFPKDQAAQIAFLAVREFLDGSAAEHCAGSGLRRITFVLYSAEDYMLFEHALYSTFPDETP